MNLRTNVGKYLSPKNKLTKAHAIVVVSGSKDRIKHAINLYKDGYAPYLILSGGSADGTISDAKLMKIRAREHNIPTRSILLEEKAKDTLENAKYIKKIVRRKKFKKLILVSSPYHQRRVFETFKDVFKRQRVHLQNSPSSISRWRYYNWWKYDKGIRITISEVIKLIWIKFTGFYH